MCARNNEVCYSLFPEDEDFGNSRFQKRPLNLPPNPDPISSYIRETFYPELFYQPGYNCDVTIPSRYFIKVDKSNADHVINNIRKLRQRKKAGWEWNAAEGKHHKFLHVSTSAGKDEGIIMQLSSDVEVAVLKMAGEGKGLGTIEMNFLQTKIEGWAGSGHGVGISCNILDMKASFLDLTIGFGKGKAYGAKDESLTIPVMIGEVPFDVTVGRKTGVGVLGSYIGIDFDRCTTQ